MIVWSDGRPTAGVAWSIALVVGLCGCAKPSQNAPTSDTAQQLAAVGAPDVALGTPGPQEAQFQLPAPPPEGGAAPQLPQRLVVQYGWGSESELTFRTDPDLDTSVEDDFLSLKPELNGHVIYRPTDWLETSLELILEKEFALHEESVVRLPNGELEPAEDHELSLQIDQANFTIHGVTDPLAFTIGRQNFEDARHTLYDTSVDVARAGIRGRLQVDFSYGRENYWDWDPLNKEPIDRIDTYILFGQYRFEDIRLAAYTIVRDDRGGEEGEPVHFGVRSIGNPSDAFSYWADAAYVGGNDEMSRDFSAYGVDVGGTYRFIGLPFNPNITLGYAFATGDDPGDSDNNEFRQTGLQSNETTFGGVSELKIYGEALDPELSNLKILTAGIGFRPAPNVSLDLVYHRYWLDEFAEELRDTALTAQMNQVSKDVGSGFDIVLGMRSLFGVRRLGVDLRAGWFFPGQAFRRNDGSDTNPLFRDADAGFSVVGKFFL